MTVPADLRGAWRRVGLLVDGTRVIDRADVLWLQTTDWYADIRLGLHGIGSPDPSPSDTASAAGWIVGTAFAGVATWDDPFPTWDHLLDVESDAGVDSSPLTWRDGIVAERFTASVDGREVEVVEEWLLMADASAPCSVARSDRAVRVEVGRWAIEVRDARPDGPFVATRFENGQCGWEAAGSLTSEAPASVGTDG